MAGQAQTFKDVFDKLQDETENLLRHLKDREPGPFIWNEMLLKRMDKIHDTRLQHAAEKLLSLLKDREPGILTWNEMLLARIDTIENIISELSTTSSIIP